MGVEYVSLSVVGVSITQGQGNDSISENSTMSSLMLTTMGDNHFDRSLYVVVDSTINFVVGLTIIIQTVSSIFELPASFVFLHHKLDILEHLSFIHFKVKPKNQADT